MLVESIQAGAYIGMMAYFLGLCTDYVVFFLESLPDSDRFSGQSIILRALVETGAS